MPLSNPARRWAIQMVMHLDDNNPELAWECHRRVGEIIERLLAERGATERPDNDIPHGEIASESVE